MLELYKCDSVPATFKKTVNQLIAFLIVTHLFGCVSLKKQEVFKTDEDFAEFSRQPSQDSSMLLLNYGIDLGALGYVQSGTAILKPSDTTKDLRLFTLPYSLDRVKWINNKTISAQFDTLPFVRAGTASTFKDTTINDITVKVSSYDYIEPNSELSIEHRETSPNGKYELVAYRYSNDIHNLNFIHVSVIPKDGGIPKYGNYLIGDMHSDYVMNGKWDRDNTLIFYSNHLYVDMVQYVLVHNRPNIKYQVINDDKTYGSKYRWTKQSSR